MELDPSLSMLNLVIKGSQVWTLSFRRVPLSRPCIKPRLTGDIVNGGNGTPLSTPRVQTALEKNVIAVQKARRRKYEADQLAALTPTIRAVAPERRVVDAKVSSGAAWDPL